MVRNGAPRCKSGLTTNEWMRTNTRGSSSSDVVASRLALSERECSGLAAVIIGSGVRSAVWASAVSLVRTRFGAACSLGGAVHAPGVKHCGPTLPCVHAATLAACSLPAHSRLTSELSARSAFPGALGRAPNAPAVSLSWCARPWMAGLSVVRHAIRGLSNRHRGVPEAGPLPVDSWPGRTPNHRCDRLTPSRLAGLDLANGRKWRARARDSRRLRCAAAFARRRITHGQHAPATSVFVYWNEFQEFCPTMPHVSGYRCEMHGLRTPGQDFVSIFAKE